MNNWDDVGQAIDEADGLSVIRAGDLMAAAGWSYWAKYTAQGVARDLRDAGFDCLPYVPATKNDVLRLYRPNSAVGRLIAAVLSPSPAGDELLRGAGQGPAEVLNRVRALVCS